jgi:hypothetical protein
MLNFNLTQEAAKKLIEAIAAKDVTAVAECFAEFGQAAQTLTTEATETLDSGQSAFDKMGALVDTLKDSLPGLVEAWKGPAAQIGETTRCFHLDLKITPPGAAEGWEVAAQIKAVPQETKT